MNATTRALNPGVFQTALPIGVIDPLKFPPPPEAPAAPARTNASNTGKAFQKEMEVTAGGYHQRRAAMIRKVDPPVRVFWKPDPGAPSGRRQVVIFLANSWLDFAGTWTAGGGRAILVEAKSTSTHRLPFNGSNGAGLKMEQVASIKTWRLSGAAVCVVWQWAGRVCLFTPEMLAGAEAAGAKSLLFENGLPVRRGEGNVVWDYLAALEEALYPVDNSVKSLPGKPDGDVPREGLDGFITYRGLQFYFARGGWNCDKIGCSGTRTIEKAIAEGDAYWAVHPEK